MEINSGIEERFGMILSLKSQRLKIKNNLVQRSIMLMFKMRDRKPASFRTYRHFDFDDEVRKTLRLNMEI